MCELESRREFLKKASVFVGTAAMFGLAGCAATAAQPSSSEASSVASSTAEPVAEPAEIEIPAHPYPYAELDLVLFPRLRMKAILRAAAAMAPLRHCFLS